MKFSNDTAYLYAVGRIRALEARLISGQRLSRLIHAASCDAVIKIALEFGYDRRWSELTEHPGRLDGIYEQEIISLYKELLGLVPDKDIIEIFRQRYDLLNMKILAKRKYLVPQKKDSTGEKSSISPCGSVPADRMEAVFAREEPRLLPGLLADIFRTGMKEGVKDLSGRRIDTIYDRLYLLCGMKKVREKKSDFLAGLFSRMIDLYNLSASMRSRFRKTKEEDIRGMFADGGAIDPKKNFDMVRWPFADIVSFLEKTSYKIIAEDMVGKGHDTFIESIDISIQKCIFDYLTAANRLIDGHEPLIGYLMKKENELRQVRLVILAKRDGVPAHDIEERVIINYG